MAIIGSNWVKRGSFSVSSIPLELPTKFTSTSVAIKLSLPNARGSWKQAGYLYQFIEVPFFGKTDVGERLLIPLNKAIVPPLLSIQPFYQLRFEPMGWLGLCNLTIFESIMPIYPGSSITSNTSDFTVTAPTVGLAVSKILSANVNRKKFAVYNSSSKDIYIDFANDVTAASATAIKVTTKSTYVDDFGWNGDVYAIGKEANQVISVREFT